MKIKRKVNIKFIILSSILISTFLFLNYKKNNNRDFFVEAKNKQILDLDYNWQINTESDNFWNKKFKSKFHTLSFQFEGYSKFNDSTLYFCDFNSKKWINFFDFKYKNMGKNYNLFNEKESVRSFKIKSDENYYFLKYQSDPFENKVIFLYVFSLKRGLIAEAKIDAFSSNIVKIIGEKDIINNQRKRINNEINLLKKGDFLK